MHPSSFRLWHRQTPVASKMKQVFQSLRPQSTACLFQLESTTLTKRAREYHQNGYLVVPQLFLPHEINAIKSEMIDICRGNRGEIDGAQNDQTSTDAEILQKYLCVHFPHKISPAVLDLATKHEATVQVLKEIISPNVKLIQTMMFLKGPGQPGYISYSDVQTAFVCTCLCLNDIYIFNTGQNWHQDEYYIPTRDKSLCGVWVAVEDATIENGCLWIIPGSHLNGFIYPTKDHEDHSNFDRTPRAIIEYFGQYEYCGYPVDEKQMHDHGAIPVEVKSGDGVFFNGYTLHRSLKNVSNGSRLSFANHYMSAESMLPWNYDDRLEGYVRDARDIVMVCGKDPYEYKGTEDLPTTRPFVRENVTHNQNF